MSQGQLRGSARARGEKAGGELQHRTQVKLREADLGEASVLRNATPDIQPRPRRYGGRQRQDIGHSYSKRSLWVRAGGRAEGILDIVLDEWDWELERRGLRFVRYADDCNIFVRSQRAGQRLWPRRDVF